MKTFLRNTIYRSCVKILLTHALTQNQHIFTPWGEGTLSRFIFRARWRNIFNLKYNLIISKIINNKNYFNTPQKLYLKKFRGIRTKELR